MFYDIEVLNIVNCDLFGINVMDFKEIDKVDVIGMNFLYGGSMEDSVKNNFLLCYCLSEIVDLFIVFIMYCFKVGGRCGVIIFDGFLFGMDGVKFVFKENFLCKFNLYIIICLLGFIFFLYIFIVINIFFFNNEEVEGCEEGFKIKEIWFYCFDMLEGYKYFLKNKLMKVEYILFI